MSIGRQVLQSQGKTALPPIGTLLVLSCVPAVGGIQLDLEAEQKAVWLLVAWSEIWAEVKLSFYGE